MSNHVRVPLWDDADDTHKLTILKEQIKDLYQLAFSEHIIKVIKTLQKYSPADEKEAEDIKFIIETCQIYPNIFSAHCEFGHITGSALIIEPVSRKLLLHYHLAVGKWLQFGGHSEHEVVPWQIAYREAIEETNLTDIEFFPADQNPIPLDIDVHKIKARNDLPEHFHLDFRYLLLTKHPELALISTESREFKWVDIDKVDEMKLDFALHRLINKAKVILDGQ